MKVEVMVAKEGCNNKYDLTLDIMRSFSNGNSIIISSTLYVLTNCLFYLSTHIKQKKLAFVQFNTFFIVSSSVRNKINKNDMDDNGDHAKT